MVFFYSYSFFKFQIKSKIIYRLNKSEYKKFFSQYRFAFWQKDGLEIGGPSNLFLSEVLPVYNWANHIDGCNFSDNTIWEGNIKGNVYEYRSGKYGTQYISDGRDLTFIENEKYDFILSCHCLEHIANPLKAIEEWARVLKSGGFIVLVVPDKRFTFDHKRDYTSFEHLLSDYESDVQETDLIHLPEILKLHDLRLDPGAGNSYEGFKKRSENNLINRALHHHVFSPRITEQCFNYLHLDVVNQYFVPPFHQITIAKKG